jgi:hypothetical protein
MPHGPASLTAQLHKALTAHGHRTGTAACIACVAQYRSGATAQHARRHGIAGRRCGLVNDTRGEGSAARQRAKRGWAARWRNGRSVAVLSSCRARRPTHGEEAAWVTAGGRSAAVGRAVEGGGAVTLPAEGEVRMKWRGGALGHACSAVKTVPLRHGCDGSAAPASQSGRGAWRLSCWQEDPTHQRFSNLRKPWKSPFRTRKIGTRWVKI